MLRVICIDAGHGQDSRVRGRYDPGAVSPFDDYVEREEASIVLAYAKTLAYHLRKSGWSVVLTRRDASTPCPLSSRVGIASEAGAHALISLHMNSSASGGTGSETLYSSHHPRSELFARVLHTHWRPVFGLKDRGLKRRDSLAVLRSSLFPSALLELGFVNSRADMEAVVGRTAEAFRERRIAFAKAIEQALRAFFTP
jgi:N-acetylmuramoyl-L-alanine amidase